MLKIFLFQILKMFSYELMNGKEGEMLSQVEPFELNIQKS